MEQLFKTITLLTAIQAIIFALVFIFNSRKNTSLRILGTFLITYVSVNLLWLIKDIKYLPIAFSYCIVPIFYIYTKSIIGIVKKKDALHLIPGLIEFLFTSVFLFYPEKRDAFYSKKNTIFLFVFFAILPALYNMFYCFLTYKLICKYKKIITNLFTDIEKKRLNWLVVTCFIIGINYFFEFLSSFALLTTNLDTYLYIFETLGSAFVVYWISIYGLNQKDLLLLSASDKKLNASTDNLQSVSKKNPETPLTEENSEQYEAIVSFFNTTKIYKNKEISLYMVSDLMQMSYREVSRLINRNSKKNFNQFVNEFRIQEAKLLIEQARLNQFNLSGIAEEVGFNSRSTFFTTFKTIEGKTPTEYKKHIEADNSVFQ